MNVGNMKVYIYIEKKQDPYKIFDHLIKAIKIDGQNITVQVVALNQ